MPTKAELEATAEELAADKKDLRADLRAARRELARRDAVHTSVSGRTVISLEMTEDGRAIVTVDRDDHRVHRIDMEAEPIQKSGLGE